MSVIGCALVVQEQSASKGRAVACDCPSMLDHVQRRPRHPHNRFLSHNIRMQRGLRTLRIC